jgi:hypothetical protein
MEKFGKIQHKFMINILNQLSTEASLETWLKTSTKKSS